MSSPLCQTGFDLAGATSRLSLGAELRCCGHRARRDCQCGLSHRGVTQSYTAAGLDYQAAGKQRWVGAAGARRPGHVATDRAVLCATRAGTGAVSEPPTDGERRVGVGPPAAWDHRDGTGIRGTEAGVYLGLPWSQEARERPLRRGTVAPLRSSGGGTCPSVTATSAVAAAVDH